MAHTVRRYGGGSLNTKLASFGPIVAERGELVECARAFPNQKLSVFQWLFYNIFSITILYCLSKLSMLQTLFLLY